MTATNRKSLEAVLADMQPVLENLAGVHDDLDNSFTDAEKKYEDLRRKRIKVGLAYRATEKGKKRLDEANEVLNSLHALEEAQTLIQKLLDNAEKENGS